LAASKTHNQVRLEVVAADADLLAGTLNNTLIKWISNYNLPGAEPPRIWWNVSEAMDLFQNAQADHLITQMGFKPTLDYIKNKYGEGWEEAAAPAAGSAGGIASALPVAVLAGNQPGAQVTPDAETQPGAQLSEAVNPLPDTPALQAQRLNRQPGAAPWIDQIRALVDKADNLDAIRDGLVALMPDMSLTDYTEAMAQALAAAALAGRYDVLQEAAGG
jgi:Mu-like prophage protein gp29